MVANMKYYVLTVVSIFLALGIGIFIGFMFDAQEILINQREDIVGKLEEKFDYLKNENEQIKEAKEKIQEERDVLLEENRKNTDFHKLIFPEVVKDRLSGIKVAVIESNDDYIYSSIGQALEASGAEVTSILTIKKEFISDTNILENVYLKAYGEVPKGDIIKLAIDQLSIGLITGNNTELIDYFNEEGLIDILGKYDESIDYLVIAGGSNEKDDDRMKLIDKRIIDKTKGNNIPVIGIEKRDVKYSYTDSYKNFRISTVDNVDTIIGKISLILAMEGRPGNYGVKDSAEMLMPDLDDFTVSQ